MSTACSRGQTKCQRGTPPTCVDKHYSSKYSLQTVNEREEASNVERAKGSRSACRVSDCIGGSTEQVMSDISEIKDRR